TMNTQRAVALLCGTNMRYSNNPKEASARTNITMSLTTTDGRLPATALFISGILPDPALVTVKRNETEAADAGSATRRRGTGTTASADGRAVVDAARVPACPARRPRYRTNRYHALSGLLRRHGRSVLTGRHVPAGRLCLVPSGAASRDTGSVRTPRGAPGREPARRRQAPLPGDHASRSARPRDGIGQAAQRSRPTRTQSGTPVGPAHRRATHVRRPSRTPGRIPEPVPRPRCDQNLRSDRPLRPDGVLATHRAQPDRQGARRAHRLRDRGRTEQ